MFRTDIGAIGYQHRGTAASVAAGGTMQLLVARGCLMASGYLISVLLARGLGPVEYGTYGVILSVLVWVEMLGSIGIPAATAKLIPQHESQVPVVEQTARLLLLIVSLGLFCTCWFLGPTFARLFNLPIGTTLFRLAILDIPFNGIYLAYQGVLHGHRRFGTLSIGLIIYSLIKLVGILSLIALGLSVSGALVVNVLATVSVLVYLVIKLPPTGSWPSYALVCPILRLAFPMGLYLVALQVLLSLDLWSLKSLWTGTGEVIGLYVAALNIAKMLTVVLSVVSGVLFASLSWALAREDEVAAQRYIQGAARFALVALIPFCTLLALHAEALMTLLYSSVYATAGILLCLQLIAFGLLAFLDIFFQALIAAGKSYQSAGVLLILIPIALLLNITLISQFGALGAAGSLVLTVCLGTTIAAVLAYRRFGSLIGFQTITRVIVATALMLLVGTSISAAGPWLLLKFGVLLGVYVLALGLLKELRGKDLRAFAWWQGKGLATGDVTEC